jgi:hypothetical protein
MASATPCRALSRFLIYVRDPKTLPMRHFLLTALLASSLVPTAIAQDYTLSGNYTVELGKPYPVIDGIKRYYEVEDGIICIKVDGRRWFVQKLSGDGLSQTGMKQYEDFDKDMAFEHVTEVGGRMYFLYSVWDRDNETEQLFAREIDKNEGQFMGKGKKVLSVKGKVRGTLTATGFYRFAVTDKFDFILSADEENLIVQYQRIKDKKELKENKELRKEMELSVAVLKPDLSLDWTADVKVPYGTDVMSMEDYTIDAKGDICIIASVYKGSAEKVKERKDEDYQYEFLRCTGKGAAWEQSPLALTGQKLMSIAFFEDAKGDLRAAGFYKKNWEQTGADGVFVGSFDASDELTSVAFHEIPKEIINMYTRAKDVKRNEKKEDKGEDLGLWGMDLNRVYSGKDGSLVVVGEKRYTTVECVTTQNGTRCYTVWHADDLLVAGIDPSNKLQWMNRIPKRASSRAPIGASFKYMKGAGAHHFLHFSKSKDLDIRSDEPPSMKGDVLVVADAIDESTGRMERHAVLNPDEVKGVKLYQLSMERLTRIGTGEILMEAYKKGKEDVLVRIAVKE